MFQEVINEKIEHVFNGDPYVDNIYGLPSFGGDH